MGRPLDLNNADFQQNHLTVVIYWRKRTGIDSLQNGHAALIIDSAGFNIMTNTGYVSWMSTGKGFKSRADASTFYEDSEEWGGSPVGQNGHHLPNRWVALRGMNLAGMQAAWNNMRTKERAHWKMFDKNCATAVARILKAGGGDDFATGHKKQAVWWPTDLLRYAGSMGTNVVRTS